MKNIFNQRVLFLIGCLAVFSILIAGCTGHANTSTPQNTTSIPATTPPVSIPSSTATTSPSVTASSSTAEIITRAAQGISNLKDYNLRRYISNSESTKSDNSDLTTLEIISQMVLDNASGKLHMDNSYNVKNSGAPMTGNSLFVVDGVLYVQGIFPDQPEVWSKTAAPPDYLKNLDQAAQLVDLLKSSTLTVLSPQTVSSGNLDIACDVLQVTPDLPKLWGLVISQPGIQLPSGTPPVPFDHFIQQAHMVVWLSQSSGVPVSAQLEINLLFDPAEWPNLTDKITIDLIVQMQFSAYNQKPVIDLPAEAKAAADLNLQQVTPTP